MKSKMFWLLVICVALLLLPVPGCIFYNAWAENVLEKRMKSLERNEDGIIKSAEPIRIERGRDRVCLLLHGFMSSPSIFGRLPEALDHHGWDVCAPLLPGHGTNPRELKSTTGKDLVQNPASTLAKLKKEYSNVVVIGMSIGGAIAVHLAAESDFDGLVLINPYFASTYCLAYVLPPRWWNAILAPFLKWTVRPAGVCHVNRPEGKKEVFNYRVLPTKVYPELFKVSDSAKKKIPRDIPTLVAVSNGDHTASPRATRRYFKNLEITTKKLQAYDHSDHLLLVDNDREKAIQDIANFLSSLPCEEKSP